MKKILEWLSNLNCKDLLIVVLIVALLTNYSLSVMKTKAYETITNRNQVAIETQKVVQKQIIDLVISDFEENQVNMLFVVKDKEGVSGIYGAKNNTLFATLPDKSKVVRILGRLFNLFDKDQVIY